MSKINIKHKLNYEIIAKKKYKLRYNIKHKRKYLNLKMI